MLTAEILCLGNELLIGRTVNKNATDISRELTQNGFKVNRVTTIRDEEQMGISVLNEIINRQPNILCISGGLGPTHDDIQLDIVAKTTNQQLEYNERAEKLMLDRFNGDQNKITEVRKKMAFIPERGELLKNHEGTAPGVYFVHNNIHIFCMPGVPAEMKSILNKEAIPRLQSYFNIKQKMFEFGFSSKGVAEADIRKLTDEIRKEYEHINFKSHPRKNYHRLELHTYAIAENGEKVRQAAEDWKRMIRNHYPQVKLSEVSPYFSE